VVISGDPSPHDVWFRQQYGPHFMSGADTGRWGDITLYKRSTDRYLAEEMFHEWSHHIVDRDRELSRLFDMARRLEPDGAFARDYARQRGEALPVNLGEQVMGLSGADAFQFGLSAPARTAVLSRGLRRALQACVEMLEPSSLLRAFTRRLYLLDAEIGPIPRATLIEAANAQTDSLMAHDAAVMLVFIGTPTDIARLDKGDTLDLRAIPLAPDIVERLRHIPNLRRLDLSYTGLSGDELGCLSGQPLEWLALAGVNLLNFHLLPIARIKTLRDLDISGSPVDDGAIPILANMTLRRLDAARTRITEEGKQDLRARQPEIVVM
jgi:hypothetical protein